MHYMQSMNYNPVSVSDWHTSLGIVGYMHNMVYVVFPGILHSTQLCSLFLMLCEFRL